MKTPKPILDRRRSVRVEGQLPFKIGHAKYDIQAEMVNISEHGALCIVEKSIPLMTQLAAALTLPLEGMKSKKGKVIHMKAVIVRRDQAQDGRFFVALFFSNISPQDQRALNSFIQSKLKHQS